MTRLCSFLLVWLIVTVVGAGEMPLKGPEKTILELTNVERKKQDLPPLKPNALLFKVAQAHSENMAKQGKMEHELDGQTPGQRLKAAGYAFARAHENIAAADAGISLEQLMKAWMDSKGHRENILNPQCTEIGLGRATDKEGKTFYTQVFAKPKEPGTE